MISPSFRVTTPLSMRLLRRLLLLCLLLALCAALLRAWFEFRQVSERVHLALLHVEQVMSPPLANSLVQGDIGQTALLLEGVRGMPGVSYAAVLSGASVVAESGARRKEGVLTRESVLTHLEQGRTTPVGSLVMQSDLDVARQAALRAALIGLGLSACVALVVSGAIFLLTQGMVSRHLTVMAEHFQHLSLAPDTQALNELRLEKRWAGDELDVLCLAVNTMQENLARIYGQALRAEREAESQARFPTENPNPVLRISAEGRVLQANDASLAFLEHLGVEPGGKLSQERFAPLHKALASGEVRNIEAEYGGRTFAFVARPLPAEGYVNLYGMDVTERKEALMAVRRSLREKEILLKEIHHRVKNNMQVISSLLFLQMEHVKDLDDRELFAESQKRIQAMALVHEEIYGSSDLASVPMVDYIPRLVDRVLSGSQAPVRVEYGVDPVRLPVTRSIPCGLVLNEMVMNAVKHAFRTRPAHGEARLCVSLREAEGNYLLRVEDNGPGLPPGFDPDEASTLGMSLMQGLARQLAGEIVAAPAPGGGAAFLLRFPVPEQSTDAAART